MPVTGRKPKDPSQRRNRMPAVHEWTEVEEIPYLGERPELPELRQGKPLHDMTYDWWGAVSTMPHCRLWTETDWQYALVTALVADAFFDGLTSAGRDLAAREKILGTTWDSRRDLRIRYVEPKEPEITSTDNVTNISDYQDL